MADPTTISPTGNEPIFPGDYLIAGVRLPATGGAVPPLSKLLQALRANVGQSTWDAEFSPDSSGKHSGFIVYCRVGFKTNGSGFSKLIESTAQQTFGYPVTVTAIILESRSWGDPGKENLTKPPGILDAASKGVSDAAAAVANLVADAVAAAIKALLAAIGVKDVKNSTALILGIVLVALGLGLYIYFRVSS